MFRESIGSVRGFRARFASQLVQVGTSERRAQIIWFRSGLQSAERMCVYVYIYIVYEISKGSNMFTKTCFKIYLDKEMFCQYIFYIFV